MYWADFLLSNVLGFSSAGADACSLSGEGNGTGKWFWKCCWSISRKGCDQSISEHGVVVLHSFVVQALGGFALDCDLGSFPQTPLRTRATSHALKYRRVTLPVNLWCDKACNLIVALFPPFCSRAFTPLVPEVYIPRPNNPIRSPWEVWERLDLKGNSGVRSVRRSGFCYSFKCACDFRRNQSGSTRTSCVGLLCWKLNKSMKLIAGIQIHLTDYRCCR